MAELLSDEEIEARLGELDGWAREGDAITKAFDRGDFVGSVEFVRRHRRAGRGDGPPPGPRDLLERGQGLDHHHSAGGLTANDFELAGRIDALA